MMAHESYTLSVRDRPKPVTTQANIEQFTTAEALENQCTPWEPYEDSKYESPINRLVPFPAFYWLRWKLLSVFHTRLLFGFVLGELIVILALLGGLAAALAVIGQGGGGGDDEAEASGTVAIIPPALAYAFATRNSLWTLFTGLPFERALFWHKLCAYLTVIVGSWHGYVSREWDWSGILLTGAFAALSIFSFWPIRRRLFEWWLRFHWVLFILAIVAALLHDSAGILFGVGVWGVDLILRILIAVVNRKRHRSILAVRLPSDVIRITFSKEDFEYKAGQYCFLCVPGVSMFEWHPFSISSSPHEATVSLHIRVLGDWTQQLYDYVKDTRPINVYIDGPYGAPGVDVDGDRYKVFLFVSGGIGITPMQSICNDILHQRRRGRDIRKVIFVWSVRDLYMVTSVLDYDKEYFAKVSDHRLPMSFCPDLLNRKEPSEVLENYFHLTRERDSSKFAEANIHPDIQPDLKFGRPDITALFSKVKACASELGETRVAVLTCGPSSLVDSVEKLCVRNSSCGCGGVKFDLHKEIFEF